MRMIHACTRLVRGTVSIYIYTPSVVRYALCTKDGDNIHHFMQRQLYAHVNSVLKRLHACTNCMHRSRKILQAKP
jgi:hypothetical protein